MNECAGCILENNDCPRIKYDCPCKICLVKTICKGGFINCDSFLKFVGVKIDERGK
jgi:hypothetical protein